MSGRSQAEQCGRRDDKFRSHYIVPHFLWAYAPERRNLDHKSAVKNQHHQACRIRGAPRSIGPKVLGQLPKVLGPGVQFPPFKQKPLIAGLRITQAAPRPFVIWSNPFFIKGAPEVRVSPPEEMIRLIDAHPPLGSRASKRSATSSLVSRAS